MRRGREQHKKRVGPRLVFTKPPPDRLKSRATILVVDDDADTRELFRDIFSSDNYVFTAKSSKSAMQILSDVRIDIVVSDLRMPEKDDGLRLLEWVRQNCPDTKFILTSADVVVAEKIDALKLGADRVIKKPWAVEDFKRSVSDVLGSA